MTTAHPRRSGAQVLIDQLRIHGTDTIFGVPGESYLAALDALYAQRNSIRYIICRQEGGAANMAEAYGKLTGKPGVCFVTRGPGATNASAGVHIAFQDSTPMILFIGQVGRGLVEREAFQEIDYRRMFGQMAKWVAQIDDAERIPEHVGHAFHVATSGRPGPVVLALPEDMLRDRVVAPATRRYAKIEAHPGPDDMAKLREMLAASKRPFLMLGGSGWDDKAMADIKAFAEANSLPVGVSFRSQGLFDNRHPNYAGDVGIGINPKLQARVKESDLLIVAGPRLGEMTTGIYTLLDLPVPKQAFVHVHAGAEELGRVYSPTLAINAGPRAFAAAAKAMAPVANPPWANTAKAAHAEYLAWIEPTRSPGAVQMAEIVKWLRETLPEDAILTNGAGNYTVWVHRFYQYRARNSQLAPTSGSMGYGLPAAVAAKREYPERTVVCFAGDGCYQMTGQELGTAVQYGANVIVVVVNNGIYGTIRMHQEREYPGRVSGTDIVNPDFAALARAYGAHGETVDRTEDFAPAFERSLKANKPAVIEVRIDPDGITPRTTLAEIRKAASAKNA